MSGSYDPVVVAVSILVAILASYTALDMAARVLVERGRRPRAWLVGGSVAMGIGIWSVHFLAMLAFPLPVYVAYDIPLTLLSAAIAIVASGLALLVVSRGTISRFTLAIASVLAGVAISGMHYTGMAAMRMPAELRYDPLLLLLSIGIAIAAAAIGFWLAFRRGRHAAGGRGWQKLAGGVVLGFAIVGMHYTGMAAARFTPTDGPMDMSADGILGTPALTALVLVFAVAILSLALLTAAADRKYRAVQNRILESIAEGFIALDGEWRVTYLNAEAERLLERSGAALLGRSVLDALPESMGGRFERECRRALVEKETVQFEERYRAEGKWLDFRVFPLKKGLAIYFQDVTRRKRGEERALQLAREQARREEAEAATERVTNILESITDRFFALDREWRFTYVNGNAEGFFGKGREELIGRRIWDLFPAAEGAAFHHHYQRALTQGVPVTFEAESQIVPGQWLEEHMYPSEDGLSVYSRDVTDRKAAQQAVRQSEERFRAFIEHATDVVTLLDEEGVIRYESPSVESELGYAPEELIGTSAFSLIHPDDVPAVAQKFSDALQSPDAMISLEFRLRHKDGSWRILHAKGRNLLHHPAIRGVVVNSREVTDRRELEEKLLQSQKMEAVGQLAGGIAHDFNNLLTSIQGHSRFLLEELGEGEPLREDAQEIVTAADRASGLTRQLLAFSRREIVQPRPLDLNAVVLEMKGMLQRLIRADLDLSVHVAKEAAWIRADLTQIQQVILNLVVNASDAMQDSGSIRIATRNVELSGGPGRAADQETRDLEPGWYAALVVEDTGHGMEAETQERIFEPFFTTKQHGKGTGLGLSTVYGIVEQSGGTISVVSEPGAGSTFTVYFPASEEVNEHAPPDPAAAPEQIRSRSSVTVLLVEDEPGVRSIARKVLLRQGYHVLEAENGREALEVAQAHEGTIDIALTDIVMPEMGGRELVERLRRERPETTAIYMSGYTHDEVVKQGIAREETAFLEKPFGPADLLSKLDEVLRGGSGQPTK